MGSTDGPEQAKACVGLHRERNSRHGLQGFDRGKPVGLAQSSDRQRGRSYRGEIRDCFPCRASYSDSWILVHAVSICSVSILSNRFPSLAAFSRVFAPGSERPVSTFGQPGFSEIATPI